MAVAAVRVALAVAVVVLESAVLGQAPEPVYRQKTAPAAVLRLERVPELACLRKMAPDLVHQLERVTELGCLQTMAPGVVHRRDLGPSRVSLHKAYMHLVQV